MVLEIFSLHMPNSQCMAIDPAAGRPFPIILIPQWPNMELYNIIYIQGVGLASLAHSLFMNFETVVSTGWRAGIDCKRAGWRSGQGMGDMCGPCKSAWYSSEVQITAHAHSW